MLTPPYHYNIYIYEKLLRKPKNSLYKELKKMNTILLIRKRKRTDLHRSALLFILMPFLILMAGCTVDDPGYVITTEDSVTQVVDADGDIVTIDSATGAITIVEFEHHELHEGDSFQCWYQQEVSDTGDKTIIAFITPNTIKRLHLIPSGAATAPASASIYENPGITDDIGATLAVYNRERNSTTTSTVWDTSTNPDTQGQAMYFTEITMGDVVGGTEIAHTHLVSSVGKKVFGGGETRGTLEWVLKQNTAYAFVIESLNDDDNVHTIELNWYEHSNR